VCRTRRVARMNSHFVGRASRPARSAAIPLTRNPLPVGWDLSNAHAYWQPNPARSPQCRQLHSSIACGRCAPPGLSPRTLVTLDRLTRHLSRAPVPSSARVIDPRSSVSTKDYSDAIRFPVAGRCFQRQQNWKRFLPLRRSGSNPSLPVLA